MPRNKLLAGGAAVAMLALAGCGQLDNASNSKVTPSSQPSSQSASHAASQRSSSTQAPKGEPSGNGGHKGEPQRPGAGSGTCKAADLKLSLDHGDSAAGTTYRPLKFTNKSDAKCTIQGFPGVSYVGGSNGKQVGEPAKRTPPKGEPIHLAPGASASANVGFVQVHNFDASQCKPTSVRGLRVYPPHDTASMFVSMKGTGCAGNVSDPQLTVATVKQ